MMEKEYLSIYEEIKKDYNLKNSPKYKFALIIAISIHNSELLKLFKKLLCNIDLIWSGYYEYTIIKLHGIKNIEKLNSFIEISTNKNLLNSRKYYPIILNKLYVLNDLKINNTVLDILNLMNFELFNENYREQILKMLSKSLRGKNISNIFNLLNSLYTNLQEKISNLDNKEFIKHKKIVFVK